MYKRTKCEYRTYTEYSETGEFETGNFISDVHQIESINHWSVYPNPVSVKELLAIEVTTKYPMNGDLHIRSITGETVFNANYEFSENASALQISTADFPSGVYFISIKTAEGVLTKKVVIE